MSTAAAVTETGGTPKALRRREQLQRLRAMVLAQPVFFGLVLAILLGVGAVASVLLSADDDAGAFVVDLGGPLIYQPLPEVLTNLAASGNKPHYIKLTPVLQLPQAQVAAVTAKEVELLAAVQAALQGLKRQDVLGEAGAIRLRDAVLGAVNQQLAPAQAQARTVLFTHLVVD